MKTFTRVRPITNIMRLLAVSLILSGATFFLPPMWINSFLGWFGVEPMPEARLMHYVLFGAGYLQVALGVLVWVIAKDVLRYRALVLATIAIFLVGAPAFYLMDAAAGMPRWWCIVDFICCFLAGGVPLIYCLWPSSTPSAVAGKDLGAK